MLLLFFFGFFTCCTAESLKFEPIANQNGQYQDFHQWILKHGIEYSQAEYFYRRAVYNENAKRVHIHNSGEHSYKLHLNKFAAMTDEEFKKAYLLSTPQNCSATKGVSKLSKSSGLPSSVDWRKKGVVSPVKNQGHCGSCWAFSTVAAMESHMALGYGGVFNLSEQQLVDCAGAFNNNGCNGGLPSQAFEYIKYNPGLEIEKFYTYHANETGKCLFNKCHAIAYVTDVVNITQYDENMLQEAVAYMGPVSIAYEVASDFRFYKSGVYESTVCKSDPEHVNHAVLAVGYNVTDDGKPYWIVKNSWGTDWGMDGFFQILRGKNMCGLSDCASYPIVSKYPPNTDHSDC